MFLEISQKSQENTSANVSFQACKFIKKETPAREFSYEFSEILKNRFFTEHLDTTGPLFSPNKINSNWN